MTLRLDHDLYFKKMPPGASAFHKLILFLYSDSYAKTLANFEKIKNLQGQIARGDIKGDAKTILQA